MSIRLPAPARREQILDVAVEVFARNGFHGASMNDVAEAAGVTKPVLYQRFDSKQDLYMALLDEVGNRLLKAITKATAGVASGRSRPSRASWPTSSGWPTITMLSCCCSAHAPAAMRNRHRRFVASLPAQRMPLPR